MERRNVSLREELRGATTRRGFLKASGIAAIAFVGAAANFAPIRKAFAADPTWTTILPQVWAVGVPVHLDLADYCNDIDGDPLIFELDHPLPPGVLLSGSIISGTPSAEFLGSQFIATADDQSLVTGVPTEGHPPAVRPRLVASPNPSNGAVRFLGERGTALESMGTLRVFGVSGRLVYERAVPVAGDRYQIGWDGRVADGTRLPSGVYVVTFESGSGTAKTRLIVAH